MTVPLTKVSNHILVLQTLIVLDWHTHTQTDTQTFHENPHFVSVKGKTKKAVAFGLFVYPNLVTPRVSQVKVSKNFSHVHWFHTREKSPGRENLQPCNPTVAPRVWLPPLPQKRRARFQLWFWQTKLNEWNRQKAALSLAVHHHLMNFHHRVEVSLTQNAVAAAAVT